MKNIVFIFLIFSLNFSFAQKWEEPDPLYICIDLKEKYIQSYSIGKNNEIASFAIYINGYESKEKRKKSIDNYNKKAVSYHDKKTIREYIEYPNFSISFMSLEKPEKLNSIDGIKYNSTEQFSKTSSIQITHPSYIIYQQKDGTYLKWKVFISNIKE